MQRGGEIEPTSGAVEAEQLCGPERAGLSEQLRVGWGSGEFHDSSRP
jgi:hypothetical protein